MSITESNCLLLIIDIQEKLINAVFNKEKLENRAKILIKSANLLKLPIFITEQYPQGLGESIDGVKNYGELFIKTDFNALTDIKLLKKLKETNRNEVILFGIETHICVYQTALALLENNFNVTIISDASGSRSEFEYKSALKVLENYGAKIKTTEMFIFELLKTAKHEKFKEIQALIK